MLTNYTVSSDKLVQGILNHGPDIISDCVFHNDENIQKYLKRIAAEHLDYPVPKSSFNKDLWFIPQEYKDLDIESFLVNQCPEENYERLATELDLFKKHNMISMLKTMKFVVDTLRANSIVWGVGRGSSVASYVLYLIGVHKIDSIKYSLPIEEFFKGETNG